MLLNRSDCKHKGASMRHSKYHQSTHDNIKNKKNLLDHIMFRPVFSIKDSLSFPLSVYPVRTIMRNFY
ncbi:mCG1040664 [Mus musculus]|nr:mCG1040664 [Mus musculus]